MAGTTAKEVAQAAGGAVGGPLAAAGVGVAGDIIGGLFGRSGQQSANEANERIARENRAFQERMSNTAYQRATADLSKAGLNRILALGQPASTPAGNVATMQNENQQLGDSLKGAGVRGMQAATAKQNIVNMKANEKLTNDLAYKARAEESNINAQNEIRNMESNILGQRYDVYRKYPQLMEIEMLLGGSTASAIGNTAKGISQYLRNRASRNAASAARTTNTTRRDSKGNWSWTDTINRIGN